MKLKLSKGRCQPMKTHKHAHTNFHRHEVSPPGIGKASHGMLHQRMDKSLNGTGVHHVVCIQRVSAFAPCSWHHTTPHTTHHNTHCFTLHHHNARATAVGD